MKTRTLGLILILILASCQILQAQNTSMEESKDLADLKKEFRWAAQNGDIEKINELIASGVDVDVLVYGGHTPLMFAVYYGQYEVAKILIDKGADINAAHSTTHTVLYHALESDNLSAEFIQLLVDSGVNMNPNPLFWTIDAMKTADEKSEVPKVMEILINAGADVNQQSKTGLTVLMETAYRGYNNLVDILISSGAEINAKTKSGRTALTLAVMKKHTETVSLLIEAGADLEPMDASGNTPLMIAENKDFEEIVDLLQKAGAVK